MDAPSSDDQARKKDVPLHVLIVEDSEIDFLFLVHELSKGRYDPVCERVETGEAMSAALDREAWDAILIDYTLPFFSGLAALELIKHKQIDLPAIIVSGTITEEMAVAAMKAGAHDYVMKDNLARLIPTIERELHETKKRQKQRIVEKALQETENRFLIVFQRSPVPMAISSVEDGLLLDVNEQYTRLMEFSREELIGHTTAELNLWVDQEERKRYIRSIKNNREKIPSATVSIRTKSGNVREVLFSADRIKIKDVPYLLSSAVDITERHTAETRLARLNDCFLQFGTSPEDNINRLVALCGEMMNATTALYNRLGKNLLCSVGRWQTPPDFKSEDKPDGHICYDVIKRGGKQPLLVRNLRASPYARTDPNILSYGLQTYLGMVVKWNRAAAGALCVVYQTDMIPSNDDLQFMTIIASAIAIEESRLRAEEAMSRTEENFRRSLDESPLGVRIATAEGKTIYVNRMILDIFGYDSIEELRTMPFKELYTPESYREAQIRKEKRNHGQAVPSEYEISIIRKDGEVRRLRVFRKLTLWNGEQRFQILYQDITRRKQAEDALTKSEEQYRALATTADIMYLMDRDCRYLFVNQGYRERSGLSNDQIIGKHYGELHSEEDTKTFTNQVASVFESGTAMECEYRNPSDGRQFIRTFSPVRDINGTTTAITILAKDITERKQMERALEAATAYNRSLIEASLDPFVTISPTGKITDVNAATERVTGYTRDALIGTDFSNYFSDPDAAHVGYLRVFREGYVRDYPLDIRHCDGHVTPVFYNATLYHNEKGEVAGIFAAARDITAQKRAEQEVQSSRQQLRALASRLQAVREEERTRIAREIHDEMGGALTAMKIDISLLARETAKIRDKSLRDSQKARMGEMKKLIDATMRTVRRIATGLRPGVLDDLGLAAALEWQLTDFQKRTGVRCEFTSSGEFLKLDALRATTLFRVAQEALTNVARHARATEVHIRLQENEHGILLEVQDNGIGIEEEEIQRPISLGILGMRERALSCEGRFTITGRPGEGTTVTVESPPVEKRKEDREVEG